MSIEALLTALKESIDANTEALNRAAAAPAAAKEAAAENPAKGRGRPAKEAAAETPKITQDMVNAALIKIKDTHGMPAAKAIIVEYAGCEKMAEIKPAKFQAVYDAAVAKFEELNAGGAADDEGGL